MSKETQVSAVISGDTRDLLEGFVRATGLKKGYVLEMALLHHLQALQEIPADVIVPPRLVLSRKSGAMLAKRLRSPAQPSKDLKELMSADGDPDAPRG